MTTQHFLLKRDISPSKRGFNLIESAIALGIAGLVIGGVFVAYSHITENYRSAKMSEFVFTTAQNIQKLISISQAATLTSGTSLVVPLIKAGAIPSDWVFNTVIKDPLGRGVSILTYTNPERFNINFNNVPTSLCIKIIVRASTLAAQTAAQGIGSGTSKDTLGYISTYNTDWTNGWSTTSFPIDPAQANTACSSSSFKNMEFFFGYSRVN